ncbi:hypothetical protein CesoFtcFv8_027306 [Champsocephalus esox]|uniref:Uncharacterized protein n=1 Tax=Champsocephalus esox TaxID=159716 RepID=A0AAN7Y2R9_9TELE|nr:hypothetical protein CesoFtcFv8_027306 [Champsocephalus esox]
MAVGIMSARASLLALTACFLQVLIQGQVFRAPQDVFLRSRRANKFLVEEVLQGNLERECIEEWCNYEEAREYFEDTPSTNAFWTVYSDGDQCEPDPCLHGANCTDRLGAPSPDGNPPTAPLVTSTEISECPIGGPLGCDQMCEASVGPFACSCLTGFRLQEDGRSCRAEAEFTCGRLPDEINATLCPRGDCPWQASLLDSRGEALCSCAVIGRRSVLTSARCLLTGVSWPPRPSDFTVAAGDRKTLVAVRSLYIHERFREHCRDDDLVLLELSRPLTFGPALSHLCLPPTRDFSENILMHSGRTGAAGEKTLVYKTLDECRRNTNISNLLSNKMFCMGGLNEGQEGGQRRPKRAQGSLNELWNYTSADMRRNGSDRVHGDQTGDLRNPNSTIRSPDEPFRNKNGSEGTQNGRHHQNQDHHQDKHQNHNQDHNRTPHGADRTLIGSETGHRTQNGAWRCSGLLPGAPVATVERGTAFLTGLLMTSSCGDGLVFTKLSRYLSWIRTRLEASEGHVTPQGHMTPQVLQYPEKP